MSPATISRYLARAGLVTPEPRKRPRSPCIRFEAELPNECWQPDFTHYPLATGADTEILTWLDDHSRVAAGIQISGVDPAGAGLASRKGGRQAAKIRHGSK